MLQEIQIQLDMYHDNLMAMADCKQLDFSEALEIYAAASEPNKRIRLVESD